jgi:hypothetical protein
MKKTPKKPTPTKNTRKDDAAPVGKYQATRLYAKAVRAVTLPEDGPLVWSVVAYEVTRAGGLHTQRWLATGLPAAKAKRLAKAINEQTWFSFMDALWS